jgi:hypothetical protein
MDDPSRKALAAWLYAKVTDRSLRNKAEVPPPTPSADYVHLLEVDADLQGLANLLRLPWPAEVPAPWRIPRSRRSRPETGQSSTDAVPYHVSPDFLALPERWRREFLRRNPEVMALLCYMTQVQELAGRLRQVIGPAYELLQNDSLRKFAERATPTSPEVEFLWKLIHRCGWRLATLLENRFGICFGGFCLHDERLGPPSGFVCLRRGLNPREWSHIWLDAYWVHSGDRERRQAVVKAWETFDQQELSNRGDSGVPQSRRWEGMTHRQARTYMSLQEEIRHRFGLPQFRRQSDEYYKGLLAVWDIREGWIGQRYELGRARLLRQAVDQAKASGAELYYRAFHLITGHPYTAVAWEVHLGGMLPQAQDPEVYRHLRAMPQRRRAGRRSCQLSGAPEAVPGKPPGSCKDGGRRSRTREMARAAPLAPGVDGKVEAAIGQLYRLLHAGVELDAALDQVDLPEWLIETLRDPQRARAVEAWAARQRSG